MTSWQSEPAGVRPPGNLPNILAKLEECRQTLNAAPKNLQPQFHAVIMALESLARVQSELNKRLYDRYESLPAKHGRTHMGGRDNIWNTGDPTEVTIDGESDPGDGHGGFSAWNHTHGFTIGQGEIDPDQISGEPNPPFHTLKEQLGFLTSVATASYAYRPWLANAYR